MIGYILKRLVSAIPVLIGISIIVFIIMALIPGDPATAILGSFATPENVEKLNVRGIVLSSVMTAFGLVVALVWKDTIIATVDYLLPNTDDGTLQGMYISATAVTLLVIVLAKFAIKLNEMVEREIDRVQSYVEDDDNE